MTSSDIIDLYTCITKEQFNRTTNKVWMCKELDNIKSTCI